MRFAMTDRGPPGARVLLATSSVGKRRELERLAKLHLPGASINVLRALDFGLPLPEIVEDADDFAGNAVLKALAFRRWVIEHKLGVDLVVADDSGLCVDVLDGRPGVVSARFSGLAPSDPELDAANNRQLAAELARAGCTESPAQYRCALACVRVSPSSVSLGGEGSSLAPPVSTFEGVCDGIARIESRGRGGFGYDPHIWLPNEDRTFAELSGDEKGERSHRGRAIRRLIACGALGDDDNSGVA